MKTTKPFSTISYNSPAFLKLTLDGLVAKRLISFYAFVQHFKEEDEKKDHIHLIIFPNGQIQTDQVTDLLQELDPSNPLKPLGVMPWHSSKWADWYLYSCHDTAYLASKGQSRQHHYEEKDFASSDEDYLHELVHTIDRTKYAKTVEFVQKVKDGASLMHLLETGQIPAPQFRQWEAMYNLIKSCEPNRNGRASHSSLPAGFSVDPDTGEVTENPLDDLLK